MRYLAGRLLLVAACTASGVAHAARAVVLESLALFRP